MKKTLDAWRKFPIADTGDTGRTVYTDEHVYFSVHQIGEELWYVEWDEIDSNKPLAREIEGRKVYKGEVQAWVDDDTGAFVQEILSPSDVRRIM